MNRILYFYGTRNDVLAVTCQVESMRKIKYILYDHTTELPPISYNSAANIPALGIASHSSAVGCDKFLVCDAETEIRPRKLNTLTEGDVARSLIENKESLKPLIGVNRYAIDQLINPDTICFYAGGEWKDGTLLHGGVDTVSQSERSLSLLKEFAKVINKLYVKVKAFYVGPEALMLLKDGRRLTAAVQSPPESDLKVQ